MTESDAVRIEHVNIQIGENQILADANAGVDYHKEQFHLCTCPLNNGYFQRNISYRSKL